MCLCCFIFAKGNMKVCQREYESHNGTNGSKHLFLCQSLKIGPKVIQAPYVFGEIALIYNTPRTCTIRGRDCELWSLRRGVFDAIMRDQDDHIDR